MGKTIVEKIWEHHLVSRGDNGPDLLYIDLHLLHEVTSPQAFDGLRGKNRYVRRPELCFAVMDHNVPTENRRVIHDHIAKKQLEALEKNCLQFGIRLAGLDSEDQGIVHVTGPELGLTWPGKTIVCGDSHTSTHGAFGALAFGIGTSEVEHVLASQTLYQTRPKVMNVHIRGKKSFGVTAKDIILHFIARYGTDAGTGYVMEFTGEAIREMSMEERMTICNMSIEAGAKAGLISPDDKTINYIKGRKYAPADKEFDGFVQKWRALASDQNATYDKTLEISADEVAPMVTWGTNPGMAVPITGCVPTIENSISANQKSEIMAAATYMGLSPGERLEGVNVQHVFIGSCTNARLSDLQEAAAIVKDRKVFSGVRALVVPGSQDVKKQAEKEGLHQIFIDAGFEWRESGCSMCLGMNPDIVPEGERCASTSNRNFEGRQGKGARTHLMSPVMAAAAAIMGKLTDARTMASEEEALHAIN
ncbi:3-isopropylmalate dehydratase large subunit [Fictibacillus iocasae]|uniref:3-isopropylmalate dehydratase large subunit n=1 Tax=Fictibacillus iocasae TaxID=2715437 RepID=A0ABW2NPZ7_9BACL